MKYKVIGTQRVGDVEPGGTVELDLPDANIAALLAGGNIEPVKKNASNQSGGTLTAETTSLRVGE